MVEMMACLGGRAERSPVPRMISQLVHDDGPDGPMSPSEIVNNTILLFVAGHDSTVNLISHCVLTVLRNPWSIELLRSRPDVIPGANEEALRLQSSVQFFPSRSALADIEIAGTTIPKGAPIFLMYGAANRDPRRFPNPNEFDPERKDNEHVGWGAAFTPVSAARSHGWKSTPRSRRSCAGWITRGASRIRRPTGSARCSADHGTFSSTSTRSDPRKCFPESVSVRRLAAARRTARGAGTRTRAQPGSGEGRRRRRMPLRPSHLGHAQTLRRACVFDPVHARP